MSFIYAEKTYNPNIQKNDLKVFGDTKIELGNNAKANLTAVQYNLIKKYGIIKSTICCPELCISFAGNEIIYASELFNQLSNTKQFDVEDVVDLAYSIHKTAKFEDDIEFIITYFSDKDNDVHIDYVKAGEKHVDVSFAWIGSSIARKYFLNRRNYYQKTNPDSQQHSFSQLAFQDVIDGCGDDSVGGFSIQIGYDHSVKCFIYNYSYSIFSSKEQIIQPGECIEFYSSATDGGFTIEVQPINFMNLIINIEQMYHQILYSRSLRNEKADTENKNLSSLMLPMEVFVDKDGNYKRLR